MNERRMEYEVKNQTARRHTIYVENPFNVKEKNHGHQPATISLYQEFGVTRLWRLTRESDNLSLFSLLSLLILGTKTLARV